MAIEDKVLEDDQTIITSNRVSESLDDKLVGSVFAQKYQITEFLGRGGMSVVYKARHLMMDKVVAVKVLHAHLSEDTVSVRRFKQEAQAASALAHPSIVSVHDFGADENGTPFLVMDLIEGQSLSQSIKTGGPLSLERFLAIMQQVASALDHAHKHGVVHRDLKPSNIMLSLVNGKELARIVDFGIAKIVTHGSESIQQLTQTGELFGSPLYMSPEQCSGSQLDGRSDIYALGCVMYESLTGKPPYVGETVFETINKQMNEMPPPMVMADLDGEASSVELIVLKCLAKLPADRYQSAAEVEAVLRSMSLSSRTGVFSRLGVAWDLANAKRASRRKSRMPFLVSTLTSVSFLSMVSMICLLGAFIDSDIQAKHLSDSRKVITEFSLIQFDLATMARAGELYVMRDRTAKIIGKFRASQISLQKRLDRVQKYLRFDPPQHKQFLKRRPEMDELQEQSWQIITSLGPQRSFQDYSLGLQLKGNENKAIALISDLGSEAKIVEKQEVRVERSRTWVLYLSGLCVFLNAAVMVSLLIYFAKGTPKRLKELAETAARFSSKKRSAGDDEIEELDFVLQELATALSEAEEREKALLNTIREKEQLVQKADQADTRPI